MQTFLPYPEFEESAHVLDRKRLWKQVVETIQILNTLHGFSKGWISHPVVQMWRGHEACLTDYLLCMFYESVRRGIQYGERTHQHVTYFASFHEMRESISPPWLGNEILHLSHRCNLVRKDFDYYSQIFG